MEENVWFIPVAGFVFTSPHVSEALIYFVKSGLRCIISKNGNFINGL